ncbi:hypothetical protein E5206_11345 [Arthrobacter sp. PAMC25564]|uniref:hypothetical protein n=1 Tax=Arthrobacter sp. PAMC25564 TaxID=2565366 RepID=UPI0010A27380|nr:hypothetical protein [Arthrobacter sp. PAMC25564]QCB97439.1 hypothetical protein E5206_11345 [Arthrobacter sp. PAMC25564]
MAKDSKRSDDTASVIWLPEPEEHDYPAAESYLALLTDGAGAAAIVQSLRNAPVTHQLAKDILRASGLPLLRPDNPHVAADLAKIAAGRKLSPVLLVRGILQAGIPAQIADGYHRVCASYLTDENTPIPVKLADMGTRGAAGPGVR